MTTAKPGLADSVDWRLYFVTDTPLAGGPERVPWFVEQAVIGGAGVVQIRDKTLPHDDFLALTKACVTANQRAYERCGRQAALVVNDRLEVAEELGLNVHMGQSDGDIREARRRLGDGLLIGLSISNQAELDAEFADQSADVLGEILGKPGNRAAAIAQLQSMAGKRIRFHTSLALAHRDGRVFEALDLTEVSMRALTDDEIGRASCRERV